MKKFLLTIMLGINCLSAADINLDHAYDRMTPRTCLEIESEYATFQDSIIARELPTDIFEAMDLVYPRVAQYYNDQAASLSAYLSKLSEQASTLTDETDIKFNAIEIEKTNNLIERYQNRAKYLTERPAQIQEFLDFITAAYATNSGLSQQQNLFSISSCGYHTSSELFRDVKEENRKHICAYDFKTNSKALNAEIQQKFSILISALSEDINSSHLHTLLGSCYNPLFHHVEHSSSFKTYIRSSGDIESIIAEFEARGISPAFISQINREQLLLSSKQEVIKTERKIKFNAIMRALQQAIIDKVFDHIESSDSDRKRAR